MSISSRCRCSLLTSLAADELARNLWSRQPGRCIKGPTRGNKIRFPGSSLHRPTALETARLLFIGEGTGRTGGGSRKPEDMPMEIVTNFGDPRFRVYD